MAILTCKNFGMGLLTPSSAVEDDILRKTLENSVGISSLHVGATSMGSNDVWYALDSGKTFDYDFEWSQSQSSYDATNMQCLGLKKRYVTFSYEVVKCINALSHFICQKVIDSK